MDKDATDKRRQQIREQRIGRSPDTTGKTGKTSKAASGCPLGEDLRLVKKRNKWTVLCRCGYKLASGTTGWRDGAKAKPVKPVRTSAPMKLHQDLTMTGFFCPSCARLLSLDIHERTSPPSHDILLDLASVEALETG